MDTKSRSERKCPREKANPMSAVVFAWTVEVFREGFKKDLQESDLYKALPQHESAFLGDKLEKRWNQQLHKAKKKRKTPSLFKAIVRTFGPHFAFYGIFLFTYGCIVRITQPIFLGMLIDYFAPNNNMNTEDAYLAAGGVILCSAISILLVHPTSLGLAHTGMKIRVACCSLIYRKALHLNRSALGQATVGQIVNLLSNDVNRFDQAVLLLHYMWIGPLQTAITTYFLWKIVGASSLAGVMLVLLSVPFQGWCARMASKLRLKIALRTDERIRLMNEIISAIMVIKMYAWEEPFAKVVATARRLEINVIRKTSFIRAIFSSFVVCTSRLAICLTVITYTLLGNHINAEKVFVMATFYNIVREGMTAFFPQAIGRYAEALVSIRRLQKFLLYEELEPRQFNLNTDIKQGVSMVHASAKWNKTLTENTLSDIGIELVSGKLYAVIGTCGSGKTSLLHAILGELPLSDGSIEVNGRLSYASQEPWVFASTVQQNILFGLPYDSEKYWKVVTVCALAKDFDQFPHRDLTIVGERGVSLSGGQRARVNLARAIYRDADIYLLDDPLSAVDPKVGKQLFEKCIASYLKHKTCVLVTHQFQYLKQVDHIILLNNGHIEAQGTMQELSASGLDFAGFVAKEETELIDSSSVVRRFSTAAASLDRLLPTSAIKIATSQSFLHLRQAQEGYRMNEAPQEIAELRHVGAVDFAVYKSYFRAGGNCCIIFIMFFLFVIAQGIASTSDYWISFWTNEEQLRTTCRTSETKFTKNILTVFKTGLGSCVILDRNITMSIYVGLLGATIIFVLTRSFFYFYVCMRSSTKLHDKMFRNITRTWMAFFDTNPSGRILNRFSKDMGAIDEFLPIAMIDTLQIFLTFLGILTVVAIVEYWVLIPTVLVGTLFYLLRVVYIHTSRNIKRLDGITRSPVFSHLSASLQGLATIRAFGAQDILMKEFDSHQDLHSSAWYLYIATSRAFGFWLDSLCVIYIAFVTFSFLFLSKDSFGGDVGLAITQSLGITGMFQWGMRQSAEVENQMTSVERVIEYSTLEEEPSLDTPLERSPPKGWPDRGKIVFDSLYLKYSRKEPPVLKGLSFTIKPNEKIGIVGRTGAGKSSLIKALFRLAEIEGTIYIDNVDIKTLGLHDLRSKVSIIPQDPILFSGTLRMNLDPFGEYKDSILWRALEDVHLKEVVSDLVDGLESPVSEEGSNFSVGQRQLICLARAIVRNNKILVLDEATANVDPQTDAFIQSTIRTEFADCTVLTIAHRLHTVMDSDKVLVMDDGRAVEFDHPFNLLERKQGYFYKMVQETGRDTVAQLNSIAQQSYMQMQEKKKKKPI